MAYEVSRKQPSWASWAWFILASSVVGCAFFIVGMPLIALDPDGWDDAPAWRVHLVRSLVGLAVGLAVGGVQSYLLRPKLGPPHRWILAGGAAIAVGYDLVAFLVWTFPQLAVPLALVGTLAMLMFSDLPVLLFVPLCFTLAALLQWAFLFFRWPIGSPSYATVLLPRVPAPSYQRIPQNPRICRRKIHRLASRDRLASSLRFV